MDGKQLKNSILQWAIQGKLVPQNPKDEPAQKLLERIAASRNESSLSLPKGTSSTSLRGPCKGTKQSKNPPSRIYRENGVWYEQVGTATPKDISDEIPFEIPESWEWVRLPMVGELNRGKSQARPRNDPSLFSNGTFPMIQTGDVARAETVISSCKSKYNEKGIAQSRIWPKGTICLTIAANIGDVAILGFDACFPDSVVGFNAYTPIDSNLFFLYALKCYKNILDELSRSTAQKNINIDILSKIFFPLPPLAEQKRIVAKLEQVLPLAEEYGAAQEQLDKLNKELPEALKKSILQEAIQGKLVPHLKSDGQADEFLKKIAKEKESLINAGKIKKEKTSAPISDEEKPFDLPSGWSWIRLGDYCERVTDQVASGSFATLRENVKSLKTPNYAIMVKTADFSNNFSRNLTYTDKHGYEFLSNSNLFGGELILSNIGSIGKVFIVPQMDSPMTLAPNSVMLRLLDENCRDYLYYFLLSPFGYAELMSITSGTAMKKFNKTDLKTIVIPVPPLPEQKRIVKKIEELYKVIDSWH
jgi:type I restriction enzyme S subunit